MRSEIRFKILEGIDTVQNFVHKEGIVIAFVVGIVFLLTLYAEDIYKFLCNINIFITH